MLSIVEFGMYWTLVTGFGMVLTVKIRQKRPDLVGKVFPRLEWTVLGGVGIGIVLMFGPFAVDWLCG